MVDVDLTSVYICLVPRNRSRIIKYFRKNIFWEQFSFSEKIIQINSSRRALYDIHELILPVGHTWLILPVRSLPHDVYEFILPWTSYSWGSIVPLYDQTIGTPRDREMFSKKLSVIFAAGKFPALFGPGIPATKWKWFRGRQTNEQFSRLRIILFAAWKYYFMPWIICPAAILTFLSRPGHSYIYIYILELILCSMARVADNLNWQPIFENPLLNSGRN